MKKVLTAILIIAMLLSSVICAFAADAVVPSVENKPAPEALTVIITDDETGETFEIDLGAITVTSVAEKENIKESEKKEEFEKSYNELKNSKDLTDTIDGLDKVAETLGMDTLKIVVKDVFDVTITDKKALDVLAKGGKIEIKFNTKFEKDQKVGAAHFYDNKWNAVAAEDIVVNEDGTVVVKTSSLSPFAFFIEGDEVVVPPSNTGTIILIVAIVVVVALAVVFVVVFTGKKKTAKKAK